MAQFILLILDLCRLRRGPQDVEYSRNLLWTLLILGIALDQIVGRLLGIESNLLARSLFSAGLLVALCWTALQIRGFSHRLVQTLCALFGCSMVFALMMTPLALAFDGPVSADAPASPLQVLAAWAGLAVFAWKLGVDAHVVRQAIESPFWLALALVTAWAVADISLTRILFEGAR